MREELIKRSYIFTKGVSDTIKEDLVMLIIVTLLKRVLGRAVSKLVLISG